MIKKICIVLMIGPATHPLACAQENVKRNQPAMQMLLGVIKQNG